MLEIAMLLLSFKLLTATPPQTVQVGNVSCNLQFITTDNNTGLVEYRYVCSDGSIRNWTDLQVTETKKRRRTVKA